ncbi:MAG: hypothetical protein LBV53_02415 [Mycoplasmataceae bacterium]|jgi:hypothetical protein|nr:hypothetical protein [Mycoplasmataceae bacterium]
MKYDQLQCRIRDIDPNNPIGKWGCYFLSLLQAAKVELNSLEELTKLYNTFTTLKYMERDCSILRGDLILKYLTGKDWTIRKIEDSNLNIDINKLDGEVIIQYCAYSGKGFHFIYRDGPDTEIVRPRKIIGYRQYLRV